MLRHLLFLLRAFQRLPRPRVGPELQDVEAEAERLLERLARGAAELLAEARDQPLAGRRSVAVEAEMEL